MKGKGGGYEMVELGGRRMSMATGVAWCSLLVRSISSFNF